MGRVHAASLRRCDDADTLDYLQLEALRILRTFGNHPSLCMPTMGNELLYSGPEDARSQAMLVQRVARCREHDSRHWYCCTAHPHTEGRDDDFYVSAWPKYTGACKAFNLDIIREFMEAKGTLPLADDFVAASARLSLLLYKEEIESALRTPGLAGLQLLGFHDHPPQGT